MRNEVQNEFYQVFLNPALRYVKSTPKAFGFIVRKDAGEKIIELDLALKAPLSENYGQTRSEIQTLLRQQLDKQPTPLDFGRSPNVEVLLAIEYIRSAASYTMAYSFDNPRREKVDPIEERMFRFETFIAGVTKFQIYQLNRMSEDDKIQLFSLTPEETCLVTGKDPDRNVLDRLRDKMSLFLYLSHPTDKVRIAYNRLMSLFTSVDYTL